jgi:AmmeMemoRadiSam system protein A
MKDLLKLAREAIKKNFTGEEPEVSEEIRKKYNEKKACFVTLTQNNELRGCIGSLQPHQELYKDVIDNAINAGFHDFRFMPLEEDELNEIKIEISVLSTPKKLDYINEDDLLKKINKDMGLILKKGFNSSTFLPQVWEELPEKQEFLENLSIKAGLSKDSWKKANFWYYNVEKIKE